MATDQGQELSEEVVAQSADIIEVRDALNLAYYQNLSLDMADSYRDVLAEGKQSDITLRLEDALRKTQALIELAKKNEGATVQSPEDIPSPKSE